MAALLFAPLMSMHGVCSWVLNVVSCSKQHWLLLYLSPLCANAAWATCREMREQAANSPSSQNFSVFLQRFATP